MEQQTPEQTAPSQPTAPARNVPRVKRGKYGANVVGNNHGEVIAEFRNCQDMNLFKNAPRVQAELIAIIDRLAPAVTAQLISDEIYKICGAWLPSVDHARPKLKQAQALEYLAGLADRFEVYHAVDVLARHYYEQGRESVFTQLHALENPDEDQEKL